MNMDSLRKLDNYCGSHTLFVCVENQPKRNFPFLSTIHRGRGSKENGGIDLSEAHIALASVTCHKRNMAILTGGISLK